MEQVVAHIAASDIKFRLYHHSAQSLAGAAFRLSCAILAPKNRTDEIGHVERELLRKIVLHSTLDAEFRDIGLTDDDTSALLDYKSLQDTFLRQYVGHTTPLHHFYPNLFSLETLYLLPGKVMYVGRIKYPGVCNALIRLMMICHHDDTSPVVPHYVSTITYEPAGVLRHSQEALVSQAVNKYIARQTAIFSPNNLIN